MYVIIIIIIKVTGDYTWIDGFPLEFSSWDMHEPSGESCAVLTDGETWNATHCDDMRPFVCKSTLGECYYADIFI